MATALNLDSRVDQVDAELRELDTMAELIFERLALLPARLSVALSQRYRNRLQAVELVALAQVIDESGDTKVAEKIVAGSGTVSKKAKKNAVARAKLGKKNPAIADKMASGELTDEKVDVIVDTDRKTNGAAGSDSGFIDAIANAGIDDSRGVAAEFITNNADSDGTQTEHDRQRLLRKANKFYTDRRTEAIMLEGDKESINEIWSAANKRADQFFRLDGGRDVPIDKRLRTHEQRLFDALIDIFRNGAGESMAGGSMADASGGQSEPAESQAPLFDCDPGRESGDQAAAPPAARSKRYTPKVTATKPTIVVGVTLDKFLGLDPDAAAEIIGTGPIADSVLAQYLQHADIVGMLFGGQGQPLWMSRSVRLASHAQNVALVIRDKRCVLCGADHRKCKAHHIMPWSAPAKGETDITKLVLVCDSCHHFIHDEKQTIYRDRVDAKWKLRPALPHEIAPPRPPKPARGQAPLRT